MKFKILCVVIIAASIAAVLGVALTGKDKAPEQVQQASVQSDVRPEPATKPMVPEGAVPQESLAQKKAVMDNVVANDQEQRPRPYDRVNMVKMSVDSPSLFGSLNTRDRVTALSLALNMNEEQEVMLTSYLEARYSFLQSAETKDFASGILNTGPGQNTPAGIGGRPEMTLDQMTNVVNIMALELKEIEGLRNAFLSELTKQQREKLEALPIARVL